MTICSFIVILTVLSFITKSHLLTLYSSQNTSLKNRVDRIFAISYDTIDNSQDLTLIFYSNCNNSDYPCNTSWNGLLFNETVNYNLTIESPLSYDHGSIILPMHLLEGCRYFLRLSTEFESDIFIIWIISHDPIFYRQAHNFNQSYSAKLLIPAFQYSLIPEVLFNIDNDKLNVFVPPLFSRAYQIDICELVSDDSCGSINDIQQPDEFSMILRSSQNLYLLSRDGISVINLEFDFTFILSDSNIVIFFNESSIITLHNITSHFRLYFNLTLPNTSFQILAAELKQNIILVLISSVTESKVISLNLLSNNLGISEIINDLWTFEGEFISQFNTNPFSFATLATSRDILYTSDYLAIGFKPIHLSNITSLRFQRDACILYTTETSIYFSNSLTVTNTSYTILDGYIFLDTWGQPFTILNNTFSYIMANNNSSCVVSKIEFIPSYLPSPLTLDKWETTNIRIVIHRSLFVHQNTILEVYQYGPALLKHSQYSNINRTHRDVSIDYKPVGQSHIKVIPKCVTSLPSHQQSLDIIVACPQQHKFNLLSSSGSFQFTDLPPNYRPPSTHGTSVHTSTHIYNYHPELGIQPNLHHKGVPPLIELCHNSNTRKECNCTKKMKESEEVSLSECKERARTHHYHHPLHIQPAITWEGGLVLRTLSIPFTLNEVNNRTDYIYSNTSSDHSISFLGGGLFHFESELESDTDWTYCSFRTQFQVFVINVPLLKEVEHAVTVITATIFGLGMGVACVILRDGKKVKFCKTKRNSHFKGL
ncbi:Cation channel sperm-associated protein subunit beta-like [Oopsacas minuta]|uniref:Cation channel sperm-associated protein subunit beta-like n=1 Tax=Oopsacas minuta TaxID=111878 RepID=A0AAV7KHL0_9METZ|nr:Cation channel sperm-associated protein subunit beta-like [Oopsacas minuta]